MASNYCINLADYYCNGCITAELGRIRAVAYYLKEYTFTDPSSTQEWFDVVCNGVGIIIPEVRGTYDGGTAVEGGGYGDVPTRRSSANHSSEYFHLFDCDNVDFYNQLNQFSGKMNFAYITETKIFLSNKPVYVTASAPITDDTNSNMEYHVKVMWSNINIPTCYNRPSQIFDSCAKITDLQACLTCNPIVITPC